MKWAAALLLVTVLCTLAIVGLSLENASLMAQAARCR